MLSIKKLMLASAIAAVSTSSFAMQAMDDAALSATTGQDGLTVTINSSAITLDAIIHDKDGFTGRAAAGAQVIKGINVSALDLSLIIDAGSNTATGTDNTLQITAINNTPLVVNLGTLQVANSGRDGGTWGINGTATDVLKLGTLTIGATNATNPLLNIQMGNEAQGAWMVLKPVFTGGLTITDMALIDASLSTPTVKYGVGIDSLSIVDNGGANLTAVINVDATTNGLVLDVDALGSATGMDVRMANIRLGNVATGASIGDVEIVGLNLNGTTITVAGH